MPNTQELLQVIRNIEAETHTLHAENRNLQRVADKATSDLNFSIRTAHQTEYEVIAAKAEATKLRGVIDELGQWIEKKEADAKEVADENQVTTSKLLKKLDLMKMDLGQLRNRKTTEVTAKNLEIALLRAAVAQLKQEGRDGAAELSELKARNAALESVIQDTLMACTDKKCKDVPVSTLLNDNQSDEKLEDVFDKAITTGNQVHIDHLFKGISGKSESDRARLFCRMRYASDKKF